jgi:hypothetical protein
MISEAIDRIVALSEPETELVYEDTQTRVYRRGAETFAVAIPSAPRGHSAWHLDTIIDFANRFAGEPSAVFYGPGSVVAVLRDGEDDMRSVVRFMLDHSAEFVALTKLARSPEWLEQKAFIRLLRITLAGSLAPSELLNKVRKIKFESGSVVTGKITRQDESLGRSLSAAASSDEGDLPEDVILEVPVYKNPGEATSYPVQCAVEIDPMQGKFQLVPFPGALEMAIELAMASIKKRLVAGLHEGIPVYHGAP